MSDNVSDKMGGSIRNANELEFVIFCIEELAQNTGRNPEDVYALLRDNGIIGEYLVPSYDVLHTQGKDYIVEDLSDLLRTKGIAL